MVVWDVFEWVCYCVGDLVIIEVVWLWCDGFVIDVVLVEWCGVEGDVVL